MLTPRDYQDAIDSNNAPNLSGIVKSLAKVIDKIWGEAHEGGHGTDWVNKHPICRMYIEQFAFLCGAGGTTDTESYSDAYAVCRNMSKEAEVGATIVTENKVSDYKDFDQLAEEAVADQHPTPWRITYDQRYPTWDPKSQPCVVDANGETVAEIPLNVNHPGEYDAVANSIADRIVEGVNHARENL